MDTDPSHYLFKLNSIVFNDENATSFTPSKINVIIGPNNSGKTCLLKEIRGTLLGQEDIEPIITKGLNVELPTCIDQLEESYRLSSRVVYSQSGYHITDYCHEGLEPDSNQGFRQRTSSHPVGPDWRQHVNQSIDAFAQRASTTQSISLQDGYQTKQFFQFLGPMFVSYSGTEDRLLLSYGEKKCGALDSERNALSDVYAKDPTLKTISPLTKELFRRDVIIDPDSIGSMFLLKTSDSFGEYRAEAKSSVPTIPLSAAGKPLYDEGDGIRSFVATMIILSAANKPILLIDEPESSLYPSHAYRMGQLVRERLLAQDSLQRAFIVTHSSHLLKGLLSEPTDEVSIIRIQRGESKPVITLLDSQDVYDNLLSRTDSSPLEIDALFSKNVVLVESPQDAFVLEALVKRLEIDDELLFIPTGGKHSFVPKCKWLKRASVNFGLVSDFDILNNGDEAQGVFKVFAKSKRRAKAFREKTDSLRKHFLEMAKAACLQTSSDYDAEKLERTVNEQYKSYFKVAPLERLDSDARDKTNLALNDLQEIGLLVLSSGELESIFHPKIEHQHNSKEWLNEAMQHIRTTSKDELMQHPDVGRLYSFLNALISKTRTTQN